MKFKLLELLIEDIGVNFYFSEPRYGWAGFSAEAFNNVLFDELPEA